MNQISTVLSGVTLEHVWHRASGTLNLLLRTISCILMLLMVRPCKRYFVLTEYFQVGEASFAWRERNMRTQIEKGPGVTESLVE